MIKSSLDYEFKFNGKSDKPLYICIAEIIAGDIEKGYLQKKAQLPSINEFSAKYSVARDTIEKAFKQLKKENYISSSPGIGYFVVGKKDSKLKVLLVFNKLSSFKKIMYDAVIKAMGSKAKVDLQIHHYDPRILKEIVETTAGKYHYYVIMPHFFLHSKKKEYLPILNSIPENELVLLDKRIHGMNGNVMGIFQNFEFGNYSVSLKIRRFFIFKIIVPFIHIILDGFE